MKTDGLESLLFQPGVPRRYEWRKGPSTSTFRGDPELKNELMTVASDCDTVREFSEKFGLGGGPELETEELGRQTGFDEHFWRAAEFLEFNLDRPFIQDLLETVPASAELHRDGRSTWAGELGGFSLNELAVMTDDLLKPDLEAAARMIIDPEPGDVQHVNSAILLYQDEQRKATANSDIDQAEKFGWLANMFSELAEDRHDEVPLSADVIASHVLVPGALDRYRRKTTVRYLDLLKNLPQSRS